MCYHFLFMSLAGLGFAAEDLEKRHEEHPWYDAFDDELARISLLVLGCMAAFMYVWQLGFRFTGHLRRLSSFNNGPQRYFTYTDEKFAKLKNHLIYAPLFGVRHNREFQLSTAINMGNLPSRFHAFIVFGIIAMNAVLCVITVPYRKKEETVAGIVRNRAGTMATVNLIPLVLMVGRNNPLITLLRVPFDTWNLIHRWLGRVVVLEAMIHILSWVVPEYQLSGGAAVTGAFKSSRFIMSGLIAGCCFTFLMLHSPSPIRHAFYETFLHLHIAIAAVAFSWLWIHLDGHVAHTYLVTAIVLWALERATRLSVLLYRNCGRKPTKTTVEALPGDAMRINLKMTRPWAFRPGQHIYLYVPSVGLWTSHPFSVGWSNTEQSFADEKGIPMTRQDILGLQKSTISLLVRRRTGFTDKLFRRAEKSSDSKVSLTAFAEGPYGSIHSMDSYGTVLLFAGGVGITHHVPFVQQLVRGYAEGTVAARRITLIWIIQSPEHLEWIRPWMTSILAMQGRRDVLRIMLFITRPRNTKEIQSPSSTVQMFPGRPNVDTLVGMEAENQVGAMGVLVCGNGSLSDDVRRVCRKRQGPTHIDYIEESFSW